MIGIYADELRSYGRSHSLSDFFMMPSFCFMYAAGRSPIGVSNLRSSWCRLSTQFLSASVSFGTAPVTPIYHELFAMRVAIDLRY